MKSRTLIQTVQDGADDLEIEFSVPNGVPTVVVRLNGVHSRRPLSEYTTVSAAQKTTLRTILTAIRDETFTKEGFA